MVLQGIIYGERGTLLLRLQDNCGLGLIRALQTGSAHQGLALHQKERCDPKEKPTGLCWCWTPPGQSGDTQVGHGWEDGVV